MKNKKYWIVIITTVFLMLFFIGIISTKTYIYEPSSFSLTENVMVISNTDYLKISDGYYKTGIFNTNDSSLTLMSEVKKGLQVDTSEPVGFWLPSFLWRWIWVSAAILLSIFVIILGLSVLIIMKVVKKKKRKNLK